MRNLLQAIVVFGALSANPASALAQDASGAGAGVDQRPVLTLLKDIKDLVSLIREGVGALPTKRTPFLVSGYEETSGLDCNAPASGDPTPACEVQAVKMCGHIGYGKAWITRYTGPNATRPSRIYEMICFD
jgi:hypothetical protein